MTSSASPRVARRAEENERYRSLEPTLEDLAAREPGDPRRTASRSTLAVGFTPIVQNIARRYRGRREPVEDLEQAGTIGLLRALDRFVPTSTADPVGAFLAYAVPTIDGEIKRYFRDLTWTVHVPRRTKDLQAPLRAVTATLTAELGRSPQAHGLAHRIGTPVALVREALDARCAHSPDSTDSRPSPGVLPVVELVGAEDRAFARVEGHLDLKAALATLPARERRILGLSFFEDRTQSQIAAELGISQMHVCRLLRRSLGALRERTTVSAMPYAA